MSILRGTPTHPAPTAAASCSSPLGNESAALLLERAFGVEFSAVDGLSGSPVFCSPSQPEGDWGLWSALCREVVSRRRPEFLQDEPPFVVLALPLLGQGADCPVAVGVFLTRPLEPEEDLSRPAQRLGMEPKALTAWARRQSPWAPEHLQRVAMLVADLLASRQQMGRLQRETESLSVEVAATYEEISLLHRLTQNLKISKSDEELGRVALEWMDEVLPAEAIVVQFVPVDPEGECLTHQARTETVQLSQGACPLSRERFAALIAHLGLQAGSRPLVLNRPVTERPDWPFPEVRQLIVVPLAEGENLFGYLAAINHALDREFGTVEASLLNSVGAILGIHSGNLELYRQQSELLAGVVRALTSAIDAKDPYTCGHSDRVARVAVRLARELGFDRESLNTIYLSGLLHDIGKIGVSDSVLRKPGELTASEYEHIKTHVSVGHKILVDLKKLDEVLPVVLHHHESWDGGGYPAHLPGEEIPLSARIVAVADAYDAMSSNRPYREGMPDERIDAIFRAGSGKQWDPRVVAAFFRVREDVRAISEAPRHCIATSLDEI